MAIQTPRRRRRSPHSSGRCRTTWAYAFSIAMMIFTYCLLSPIAASAADYTWTGGGLAASTADEWSNGANWLGGTAPAAAASIGTLTFPALSSGACTANPPTAVCYHSENNLSGLSVNQIVIDSGAPYAIGGDPITLGSGGITATEATSPPSLSGFAAPILLGASQTWSLDSGWLSVGSVTGSTDALTIDLSSGATLDYQFADAEVGPVTITGTAPGDVGLTAEYNGSVEVGVFDAADGLNGSDGNPISLTDAELNVGFSSMIGPLTTTGGFVAVDDGNEGSGQLTVAGGVTLDPTSVLQLFVTKSGTTPAADYSQLNASGAVRLAGALELVGADLNTGACLALSPGDVDTLITTTGTVEGTFADIPNGSVIPVSCAPGEPATVKITYSTHAVTATVIQAGSGSGGEEPAEESKQPSGGNKEPTGGSSSGSGSTTSSQSNATSNSADSKFSGSATPTNTDTHKPASSKTQARAQKLAKALKACRKLKKTKRAKCEKTARKRYQPKKKSKKKAR